MIPFEHNKLAITHVKMKSVTTAGGGSMRIVDEEITDKEVYKRVELPYAVARAIIVKLKRSKFFKPLVVAVATYDGLVLMLEHQHHYEDPNDMPKKLDGTWLSNTERHFEGTLKPLTEQIAGGSWYIDGSLVYWLPTDVNRFVHHCEPVTSDRKFKVVPVDAYSLAHLSDSGKFTMMRRYALAFIPESGDVNISPPCWADVSRIGAKKTQSGAVTKFPFDTIDRTLAVNLAFALSSAKILSKLFTYEFVAPLQLPELMIRLRTVNLPSVLKEVKMTFDIGMPFSHCLAWLIGATSRVKSFDQYVEMRTLFKYLTTKGIFRKDTLQAKTVFNKGFDVSTLPLKTIEEADQDGQRSLVSSDFLTAMVAVSRRTDTPVEVIE